MFRKSIFILIVFFSLPFGKPACRTGRGWGWAAFSQNIFAFSDYRNYFFAFENGITRQLTHLPVKEYKIGGNGIAFVDNLENFRIYHNGIFYDIMNVIPDKIFATDNLFVYQKSGVFYVFDRGERQILSYIVSDFAIGDSIVGFIDNRDYLFNIYYNGKIQNLDGISAGAISISSMKAGDNILAYINHNNYLKVFYQNAIYELEQIPPVSYQTAANIVAYVDGYTQSFKVFYAGATYNLETIAPKSYKTGDDLIAYVDVSGSFKIFYRGKIIDASAFEPVKYQVEDNVVWFNENNFLKVFHKGKIYSLENYIPEKIVMDYNSLAYIDSYRYLKIFYDGKTATVSQENISDYQLFRNVLFYKANINDFRFFVNGQNY